MRATAADASLDDLRLRDELLAFLAGADVDARAHAAECFGEPYAQRAELQEVEQPLQFLRIRGDAEAFDRDPGEGCVVAQQHQVEVLARPRLVFDQRALQLRSLRVDVGEDPVEAAVRGDQLGRGLLPHSGHARQVVAGVAAQRRVLRVQGRGDTGLLDDAGLVVERIVADPPPVVQHLHVRIGDELIAVAIAGDDEDVMTGVDEQVDSGGDEVVGLPPCEVDGGDPDGVEHLAHEAHLLAEDVGRRRALRLVLGLGIVAECGLGSVERRRARRRACGPSVR